MTKRLTNTACKLFLSITVITLADVCASAQEVGGRDTSAPVIQKPSRTSADEEFELNISERRITEDRFAASTEVEAGGRGVWLRVGVSVAAERIDMLLRNVTGRVRFRATLAPVLRLLDTRDGASPPPP